MSGVRWESLEPGTFEEMVSVLISRLHPEAQRIDGSGGDGGRDVQVPTGDGLVIFELKSFTGRMSSSRRRQVEASLERASQHEPAEWRLVVPIDPTPGELAWFEGLSARYGFGCRWLGRCWLDGEMAHKPEIARHYAHGQRYELQEVFDLLRGIGAEPPPVGEGIVRIAAEQASSVVATLNTLDPHYVFELRLQPGGRVHVSVMPRYPGAERDRPWLSARFDFADTAEGDDARRTLQDSLGFGTRGVIPAEHIAELTLNVPAGLGTRLGEGYEVELGTPAPNIVEEVSVALAAVDSTGSVMAQLPLVAEDASRGTRGVEISLHDKSGAVTATVRGDASELTFNLIWRYSQPDEFAPLDLLPAVKFAAAVEGGAHIAVVFNGETIGPESPGPVGFGEPREAARFARLLEHLVNVQTKTGVFFDISTQLTSEEVREIVVASRLLNGESVQATWERIDLHVTPDGHEVVADALSGSSSHNARLGAHMSLTVQGQTIPIGDVTRVVESARVLSWEAADDDSPTGTTVLRLVPADTNNVTILLDTECL